MSDYREILLCCRLSNRSPLAEALRRILYRGGKPNQVALLCLKDENTWKKKNEAENTARVGEPFVEQYIPEQHHDKSERYIEVDAKNTAHDFNLPK